MKTEASAESHQTVLLKSDSVIGDFKPVMQASNNKSNRSDQFVERIVLEGWELKWA